jgi:hypothetical protein
VNLWGATPPLAATLLCGGTGVPAACTPTVSRNVTVTDYLGIPAGAVAVMAISSLVLSVVLLRSYDRKYHYPYSRWRVWLERPILGSGAWTANDSWATNISTGLVVVGTVLGATTATNSLFPGISLDRFAIANIAAGFFVVAAPVVFGILYSRFTANNPGLTADATVALPALHAATISIPSGASVTLAADTTIRDGRERWATVRAGGAYQIPPGAQIQVVAGIQAVVARMLAKAVARASVNAAVQAPAEPAAPSVERVVEQTVTRTGMYAPAGALTDQFEALIEDAVREEAKAAGQETAPLQAAVQAGIQSARDAAAAGAAQASVTGVQAGTRALRLAIGQAAAQLGIEQPVAPPGMAAAEPSADTIQKQVQAPLKGSVVRAAVQEVIHDAAGSQGSQTISDKDVDQITEAIEGGIPKIGTYAAMAYSGTADIGVMPDTVLLVTAAGGTWTVQAADVLAQPPKRPAPPAPPATPARPPPGVHLVQLVPPTPPDVPLEQPLLIDATGGAKVTVTGTADISLRKGAVISATQRPRYPLPRDRQLQAPQGTNIIVANLSIILIVNLFTMFGIGAELGIAGVLAGFSDATGLGRAAVFVGLAAVAILVIIYAITATRAMADPQPGSSISSQAGASFTL